MHHQGIKEIGKDLIDTAHSPDGLIEAIEMPEYPYLVGVQWHPEELQDSPQWNQFLKNFVQVCSN